jgi:hypothetical protein
VFYLITITKKVYIKITERSIGGKVSQKEWLWYETGIYTYGGINVTKFGCGKVVYVLIILGNLNIILLLLVWIYKIYQNPL